MPEKITLMTDDGIRIVGDWQSAPTLVGAVVLLHMMPDTRQSWAPFQRALAKRSIGSLAIDLRGHGESTETKEGNAIDYHSFADADHQTSLLDVEASITWLRRRGLDISRIALCGASIGANLALQALTHEPTLAGAVLLSPGENYHGLMALEDVPNVLPDQTLYIVASEDDPESYDASKKLYEAADAGTKSFTPYQSAGHGTTMFSVDPGLLEKAADWFAEMITRS